MQDIWNEVVEWANRPCALARVVQTWGSSPRQVGAAMLIGGNMQVAGSVSGGCIEGAVIEEAMQVLKGNAPRQCHYGVEDEKAWSVGLSCGGEVSVWVEPHWAYTAPAIWQELRACVQQRRPAVLLTRLQPAPPLLVEPGTGPTGDWGSLTQPAVAAALAAHRQRQSQLVEVEGVPVFLHVFPRPEQLLVIGAGHIAIPLVQFARALDFETIVMDPRRVFAAQARFPVPPHQLLAEWPHELLSAWDLNEDTYAVLLTHDPKIDDPALQLLLKAPIAYIGALGSRKTHAKRCERLREAGFAQEEIARIRGPVGLDIGARTPAEIALSIIAQVVGARRSRQ